MALWPLGSQVFLKTFMICVPGEAPPEKKGLEFSQSENEGKSIFVAMGQFSSLFASALDANKTE